MCGINAVVNEESIDAFSDLYEGLYHLQHRGQDSFGISYFDEEGQIQTIKNNALLSSVDLESVNMNVGLGHVRYPTSGGVTIHECQPFIIRGQYHRISMVHNGQVCTIRIKEYFESHKILEPEISSSDSIYLLHLLSFLLNRNRELNNDIITDIVREIQTIVYGSFNCICLLENYGLFCFKDKYSYRPLIYGLKVNDQKDNDQKENSYMIASESISLTSSGYKIIDDIYGRDVLFFKKDSNYKLDKRILLSQVTYKPCLFEWVYLAREESIMYKVGVYQARIKMGEYLAEKIRQEIDIDRIDYVVPVPDTSKPVALTVAKILNIPYYECITKNRYVNRTFIMNSQKNRKKNIKRKLNVIKEFIDDKNLLIIDDSIVRGNTMKHIVNLLKDNGSKELYVASSCPEIVNKNIYGIAIPNKDELICHTKTNEQIKKELGLNHLVFQDLKDLEESIRYYNPELKDFEKSVFIP